ncbi:MAG: hypothetical protein A2Z96_02110 [Spirochaetes bacterium GWB1_48_6]|nr:MAG: hypothetical protein A2Z96_02110 [Spirochaetes bacterium GWB1_48_6]
MIEVRDLWVKFGEKEVLKGLNLLIEEGKTTVVLGRSGIGKSVTMKCILGLIKPQRGQIYIDGEEFLGAGKARQKELISHIGMLMQNGALFDSLTVFDNIAFPLRYHRKYDEKEIGRRVHHYAEIVQIQDALDMMPKDLSGGMKRKAALARAIIQEPQYLFYDEPTTGLDPTSSALVEIAIRKLKDELKVTSLVVTHDIELVYFLAEEVALLEDGLILYKESRDKALHPGSEIYSNFIASREKLHRESGYV